MALSSLAPIPDPRDPTTELHPVHRAEFLGISMTGDASSTEKKVSARWCVWKFADAKSAAGYHAPIGQAFYETGKNGIPGLDEMLLADPALLAAFATIDTKVHQILKDHVAEYENATVIDLPIPGLPS